MTNTMMLLTYIRYTHNIITLLRPIRTTKIAITVADCFEYLLHLDLDEHVYPTGY